MSNELSGSPQPRISAPEETTLGTAPGSGESTVKLDRFMEVAREIRGGHDLDEQQRKAVEAPPDVSLFIVAGPGSGKTTVLALRILKLIMVDGIKPEEILATTFTRKAARELKSRILGWGSEMLSRLKNNPLDKQLSRIRIGTIDSIIQNELLDLKEPGAPPPILIDDLVSEALMRQKGLLKDERYKKEELEKYLQNFMRPWDRPNLANMVRTLKAIRERIYHDRAHDYLCDEEGNLPNERKIIKDIIDDYQKALEKMKLTDFVLLEERFRKIMKGEAEKDDNKYTERLRERLGGLRAIFVDEYQDTNLLQEEIYFELAKGAISKKGSIAVVGDDDQSIYRFRGSTVELFIGFRERIEKIGKDVDSNFKSEEICLNHNYRSTNSIVEFCESFITSSERYKGQRAKKVSGVISHRGEGQCKVLVIRGSDEENLASQLAEFVKNIGEKLPKKGSVAYSPQDCVLLSYTVKEEEEGNGSKKSKKNLFLSLREKLEGKPEEPIGDTISVFNPRGSPIYSVKEIRMLCGAILEIIDPGEKVLNGIIEKYPKLKALKLMKKWREEALGNHNKNHNKNHLDEIRQRLVELNSVNLMDIAYEVLSKFEPISVLLKNSECSVYLEATLRVVTGFNLISAKGGNIVLSDEDQVKDAIWNVFLPIAQDLVYLDEDLFELVPKKQFQIMTIHQSKGLEFPVVIVYLDLSDDLPTATPKLEDEIRQYSPLGKPKSKPEERAIDDLIRLYYVAFSRAQDALVLAILDKNQSSQGAQRSQGESLRSLIGKVISKSDLVELQTAQHSPLLFS